jgi:hypothetical protein
VSALSTATTTTSGSYLELVLSPGSPASDLERDRRVLRLVERVVVSAVLELAEDAIGQFGCLHS